LNEFVKSIITNISILFTITVLYSMFFNSIKKFNKIQEIGLGTFIGLVGIVLILIAARIETGIVFDARSILVCISGMFLGVIPTLVAVVIMCIYRWCLGGGGAIAGVAVTIITAMVGLIWNYFRKDILYKTNAIKWWEFYAIGVIAHIGMLLCMFLLPLDKYVMVLKQITIPVLLIYPVGVLLISRILFNQISLILSKNDLERREALYKSLFENAPVGISVAIGHQILEVNEYFLKIVSRTKAEFLNVDWEKITHPDDVKKEIELFEKLDKGLINSYSIEKRYIKPDGSIVWVEMNMATITSNTKKESEHICIVQEITERKEREERIKYVTYHDLLTGLHNRNSFEEVCKNQSIIDEVPFSIISADIDGLKLINDAFGHESGDLALRETGEILKECICEYGEVYRAGGDEFFALLANVDENKVKTIINCIEDLIQVRNRRDSKLILSISLGSATTSCKCEIKTLLKQTEENMYRKKLLQKNSFYSDIVNSIKATMFEKSNETEEHAERIAVEALKVGRELGLKEEELNKLELTAVLHDIGKISIDLSLLTKSEKLSNDEWATLKKHAENGYRIAHAIPELRHIAEYILYHHERWDGNGYPCGISAEEIPLISRIISIADSYDAMTNDRPYKKAMSKEEAFNEIISHAGTQFDPKIAKIFIQCMKD